MDNLRALTWMQYPVQTVATPVEPTPPAGLPNAVQNPVIGVSSSGVQESREVKSNGPHPHTSITARNLSPKLYSESYSQETSIGTLSLLNGKITLGGKPLVSISTIMSSGPTLVIHSPTMEGFEASFISTFNVEMSHRNHANTYQNLSQDLDLTKDLIIRIDIKGVEYFFTIELCPGITRIYHCSNLNVALSRISKVKAEAPFMCDLRTLTPGTDYTEFVNQQLKSCGIPINSFRLTAHRSSAKTELGTTYVKISPVPGIPIYIGSIKMNANSPETVVWERLTDARILKSQTLIRVSKRLLTVNPDMRLVVNQSIQTNQIPTANLDTININGVPAFFVGDSGESADNEIKFMAAENEGVIAWLIDEEGCGELDPDSTFTIRQDILAIVMQENPENNFVYTFPYNTDFPNRAYFFHVTRDNNGKPYFTRVNTSHPTIARHLVDSASKTIVEESVFEPTTSVIDLSAPPDDTERPIDLVQAGANPQERLGKQKPSDIDSSAPPDDTERPIDLAQAGANPQGGLLSIVPMTLPELPQPPHASEASTERLFKDLSQKERLKVWAMTPTNPRRFWAPFTRFAKRVVLSFLGPHK